MRSNEKAIIASKPDSQAPSENVTEDTALQLAEKIKAQIAVRKLRGTIQWEGNFEESRLSRFPD